MIPRIIHWGCFGGHKLSELNHRCMATWKTVLPDYKIMNWDDANGPKRKFFMRALEVSPINAHNYIGIWALYRFGGVMMDNDVEVIRPFDLEHGMFVGFQRNDVDGMCLNNAVLAARPHHPVIRAIFRRMEKGAANGDPLWFGPGLLTEELHKAGVVGVNTEQKVGDIMVYDKERFYPFWHGEKIDTAKLTSRTFAVHHWEGSWNKKKPT